MRIRRSILWLVAIVTVFIVLALWLEEKKPAETPLAASNGTNFASPPKSLGAPRHPIPANTNRGAAEVMKQYRKREITKGQATQEILSRYNDVPIDFYGKLEDQFGKPVSNAEIKGSIMVINGQREGTDHPSATSDAAGLFQFHGKGEQIGIMPHKEGYALASTNGGGIYSLMWPEEQRADPDPNNPVIIKMWKLQGAEPLLKINQTYRLNYSGPVNFDLLTGTIVPTCGDIRITVNRAAGRISTRNQLDWSLTIEAVNGGLVETSMAESRVTYIAPANGYQPSVTFMMSSNNNTWYEAIHQMFFLTSRNGKVYSKANFSFRLNENPDGFMNITFRGVANTNSSRNWEGDPNTMAAGQ